jgi:hypothetical protein
VISLEVVTRNALARSVRIIEASPDALREAASRLEELAKGGVLAGEAVLCPLTQGIVMIYKPEPAQIVHATETTQ